MKKIIIILLSLGATLFSLAQAPTAVGNRADMPKIGIVKGKVLDNENGIAVEYASVVVFSARDSSMVGGLVTDKRGVFEIDKLPFGSFYIRVSFMGYQDYFSPAFSITQKNTEKNLGNINLVSNAQSIAGVEITGERRLVEYSLDKRVVNVEKNIVNDGGTALDVLQNVPSINVDTDGNVSMKGSTSVSILIDGRPANLSGVGLEQLPAASIETVEIVSNPSAKYNPEGMSGIINIKTKKRVLDGLNGVVNVSTSTSNRHNASINLNYGTKKFNFFTNANFRYSEGGMTGNNSTKGDYKLPSSTDTLRYEFGSTDNSRNWSGGGVKLGATYNINRRNALTLTGSLDLSSGKNDNLTPATTTYTYNDEDHMNWLQTLSNTTKGNSKHQEYGLVLGYVKTFEKPRKELTLDMSLMQSKNNRSSDIIRTVSNSDGEKKTFQNTDDNGGNYDFDAQLNFVQPLRTKGKIEMGYQGKIRGSDNDNQQLLGSSLENIIFDPDLSSRFKYNENIHGLYATWGDEIGKFTFQVGGRLEYAFMDGETTVDESSSNKDTAFDYNYLRFYPSVHISRKLADNQELQLSYSRRVSRPRAWSLNPFVDYSNYPSSINYGNPTLVPEDVHSIELNHAVYGKKTSFYTTLYFRQINDVIRRYSFDQLEEVNDISYIVRHSTHLNYESGTNYGIDLVWEQELLKWWRFNLSGSFYRNRLKGGLDDSTLDSEGYSYSFKANSNMTLPQNLTIQISAQYRGPQFNGQNEMLASFFSDIAIRKGFYDNKLSVGLRVSDLFNTMKHSHITTGEGFVTESTRQRKNSRALTLTASYKINQGIRQQRKTKNTNTYNSQEEEME